MPQQQAIQLDTLPRKRGSIVRIKLDNFMTFTHCEFKPGPRMNVILGPNGSGKSSLICAIGLGLGGSPKILGRSSHTREFIRKGQDEARIEIELFGGEGKENMIIQRRLIGSSSEWRINNSKVTEETIQATLRTFEIQVDNLVQFLPQDKVAEFAQFDGKQLLRETIRAVLGTKSLDTQDELIAHQKEHSQLATRLGNKRKELDELEAMIKRDQHIVEKQKDRKRCLEEIEWLEKKLLWLKFETIRDDALAAKNALKELEEKMRNGSTTLEPLKLRVKEYNSKFEKLKKEHDAATEEQKKWATAMANSDNEASITFEAIAEAEQEVKDNEKAKNDALKKVATQKKVVADFEDKLRNVKGEDYFVQELNRLKLSMTPLNEKKGDLESSLAETNSELNKKKMELTKVKKDEAQASASGVGLSEDDLRVLENERCDLIKSKLMISPQEKDKLLKLRSEGQAAASGGSGRFQDLVLGPIVSELRPRDPVVARCLESTVRAAVWRFMIAKNPEDHRVLMDAKVNAILVGSAGQPPPRVLSRETMNQLGIRGYLDEELLQNCNPIAVEAARRLNGINQVLVGTDETDRLYQQNPARFEKLLQLPEQSSDKIILITPTRRFDVSRSRYGRRDLLTKVTGLRPGPVRDLPLDRSGQMMEDRKRRAEELSSKRVDLIKRKQELEALVIRLDNESQDLRAKLDAITKDYAELRETKKRLEDQRNVERSLQVKLETALKKLADLEKTANQNWEHKEEKARKKVVKAREELVELVKTHAALASKVKSILLKLGQAALTKTQVDVERTKLQELLKEEEEFLNKFASERQRLLDKQKKLMSAAVEAKRQAEDKCPLTDEVLEFFGTLPETLHEVENRIIENKAVLSHIFEETTVLATFERNVQRRDELKAELSEENSNVENKRLKLMTQIEDWKSQVKLMADNINEKVQYFFSEINKGGYACVGEVGLVFEKRSTADVKLKDKDDEQDKKDQDDDIASAAMEIKVKFRQEQKLQRLDPNVFSGGERSLTTFLYMLALQELSKVPFRVVDEINQGMDADKERLAFYRLSEVSSRATSQYFLATPKLLPGLAFPKDATILFVFNGPYNLSQKDWDLKKFIQAQQKKRLSNSSVSEAMPKRQRPQAVV